MKQKVILDTVVNMLPADMENFLALIKCNEVEAGLSGESAKKYTIHITEEE